MTTLSAFTVTIITKTDSPDNVLPNAPLEIRNRLANGTSGTLASIFSDAAGTLPITQTGATTDSLGQFLFYASPAPYNAVFDNNGTPVISAIDVGLTTAAFASAIDRLNPPTLAIAIADATLQLDDLIHVKEDTISNSDVSVWLMVLKSGVTANGKNIIDSTGETTLSLVYQFTESLNLDKITDCLGLTSITDGISFVFDGYFDGDGVGGEWSFGSSVLKTAHDGVFVISTTVPWDGSTGQAHQDFIDGVGETDPSGSGCIVRQFTTKRASDLKPLFVEQFLTGFQGRGQLDVEPDNLVSEQDIVGNFSAGAGAVVVTTPGNFKKGGHITIRHDNDDYWSYHILDVIGSTVSIVPGLLFDASGTRCERTWFNKAHPGKFYMRQLAQRVANTKEFILSMPEKRVMMSQYDTNPNDDIDNLTVIGGAVINFFDAANIGAVDVGSPVRFNIGRTALVDCTTVGDGAKSFIFQNTGAGTVNLRTVLSTSNSDTGVRIEVFDDSGETIPVFKFDIPASISLQQPTYYDLPITLKGSSNTFFVNITAFALPTSGSILIDQLETFEDTNSNNSAFSPDEKKILVAFGDSWIAGDLGSSLEREPIPFQLQAEMPFLKIINAGVGGNTAGDLLIRFDTDVTPLNPDYVLINTGTNDVFNPPSGTFFPNAVDAFVIQIMDLISKCQAIGAKPILIGVPAMAESDTPSSPSFVNFLLNDRARLYSQFFTKDVARLIASTSVGAVSQSAGVPTGAIISFVDTGSGTVTKWADGRMEVFRNVDVDTTADAVVSFPENFVAGSIPWGDMSVVTIQSGNTTTAMKDAFMQVAGNVQWVIRFPTVGTITDENFNLIAIGRWF